MKIILPFTLICFLSVSLSSYSESKFIDLLSGEYVTNVEDIASNYTIEDVTDIVFIAGNKDLPVEARLSAANVMGTMLDRSISAYLKDVSNKITSRMFDEIKSLQSEFPLYYGADYSVLESTLLSLGKLNDLDVNEFLVAEFADEKWRQIASSGQAEEFVNDHLRLPIYCAIGEAALHNPDIFRIMASLKQNEKGLFRRNLNDVYEVYRTKLYKKNPALLPEGAYSIDSSMEPKRAIFHTQIMLQDYLQSKGRLPEYLLELTIPQGGEVYYLKGDMFSAKDEKLLTYKTINGNLNGADCWTCLLISVGPNGKVDLDVSKLELGMQASDARAVFGNSTDDVYGVFSAYLPN